VYDHLIIGGGISGCTLAFRLIEEGAKVMVIDQPANNISSLVAAGIVSPLTGKRIALTWKATELFEELHRFYPFMERKLNEEFFYPLPTMKIFESIYEQNEWMTKRQGNGFDSFIEKEIFRQDEDALVNNPYGGLRIIKSGRLNLKVYLRLVHRWLKEKNALLNLEFDSERAIINKNTIEWEGMKAQSIIFCDGTFANRNKFFNFLPFKPVHGELLEVEMPNFSEDRIINKGLFILPVGQQKFMVGATYNWEETLPVLTNAGRMELELKLKELVNCQYTIINQWAGIRPSTNDRRPFLGKHPEYNNVFIFGGLGSKGVSLVPLLSGMFTNYLLHDVELPRDVDICRLKLLK